MKAGQTAPRKVTTGLRQQAWWVMRRRVVFSLPELLATIATGAEKDAANNLARYVRALELAGFVSRDGRGTPRMAGSHGCVRYRVVRDNGRRAPVWRSSAGGVYDPNTGDCYDLAEAGHELAYP